MKLSAPGAKRPRKPCCARRRRRVAPTGILQWAWRLRRRWAGICDGPRPGPGDAGTLDQRHRQSGLRLSGVGRRQRLHLVGQQPREPAHAVVERPGLRPSGRSVLSTRRRHRRTMVLRLRCRSATTPPPMLRGMAGATAASSMRPWHRRESAAVRSDRRSDQDLAADAAQYVAAARGTCR